MVRQGEQPCQAEQEQDQDERGTREEEPHHDGPHKAHAQKHDLADVELDFRAAHWESVMPIAIGPINPQLPRLQKEAIFLLFRGRPAGGRNWRFPWRLLAS